MCGCTKDLRYCRWGRASLTLLLLTQAILQHEVASSEESFIAISRTQIFWGLFWYLWQKWSLSGFLFIWLLYLFLSGSILSQYFLCSSLLIFWLLQHLPLSPSTSTWPILCHYLGWDSRTFREPSHQRQSTAHKWKHFVLTKREPSQNQRSRSGKF